MPKKDSHWDERAGHPWAGKAETWGRKAFYKLASVWIPASAGMTTARAAHGQGRSFTMNDVERLLIIKEPYRMGDLFQITPALRALKDFKPSLYIGLVIQDRNLPVFEHNPHVDRIFLYRKREFNRNPLKAVSLIQDIRGDRFDAAVTLETERAHLTNDLLAYFSGAAFRLRYDGRGLGNEDSNVFYNVLVPLDPGAVHQVDRNFGVFKGLGLELNDRSLVLRLTAETMARSAAILKPVLSSLGLPEGAPFIAFHPGSYKINNRWPLENYLKTAAKLKEIGKAVVFILGPSEKDWKGEIEKEGFPILSGISIPEMAGVLKLSSQVLCNDTGVMHISGAVGARTLALFGETRPELWKPPSPKVSALQAPDRKMSSIRVEEVLTRLFPQKP